MRAANVMLEQTVERVIVGDKYCDKPLGLYVIRGENVVLLGTMVGTSPPPLALTLMSRGQCAMALPAPFCRDVVALPASFCRGVSLCTTSESSLLGDSVHGLVCFKL